MASHDHCLGKQLPQRLVAVILFGSVAGRETTAHSDDLRVARETLPTGLFARHRGAAARRHRRRCRGIGWRCPAGGRALRTTWSAMNERQAIRPGEKVLILDRGNVELLFPGDWSFQPDPQGFAVLKSQ